MASIDEFSTAESVLVLRFMKGEITGPEFGLQYEPINNRHRSNLVNALGKHYERYEAVIKSDPRYAWGSSIGRNQGAFEDELLRRNLGR